MKKKSIQLKKVQVHNLKSVNLSLPKQELIVFTGVSGSGKSSLAFDTLYVEGQRRYVESLSQYARKQMGDLSKPDLESASGITPTISIEQKTAGRSPRSTVATMTEIYDHLRLLFARIAIPHCPISGEAVLPQSKERIIRTVQSIEEGCKLIFLAPFARGRKAEFKEDFAELLRKGYMRVRIDGELTSLEEIPELDGNVAHDVDVVIDRVVCRPDSHSRIAEAVIASLEFGEGICIVLNTTQDEETLYSMHAYSPASGLSYPPLEPQDFSFNSPRGMCLRCHGIGEVQDFDLEKIIDPNKSISEDCCDIASSFQTVRFGNIYRNIAEKYKFDIDIPWKKLSKKAQNIFLYGTGEDKWIRIHFIHPETGATWSDYIKWKGVLNDAHKRYTEAKSDSYRKRMHALMEQKICPECGGSRLKPYPSSAKLDGSTISQITTMTVKRASAFFNQLRLNETDQKIADDLLKEIRQRLHFLLDVGLHYLTLDRTSPTLSGGESQRVRLASQIGCGLVGITYILDEPSIGLHPRDNEHLIRTLLHLRDLGNTVIVVEHDEDTIWAADRIVDFGPGPGHNGGEILCNGPIKDLLEHPQSITGAYLKGEEEIPIPKPRRKPGQETITIKGAKHHNLKKVKVDFPLGVFIAVTGVSGSGKSSLVSGILAPSLENQLHRAEHPVGQHDSIEGIEHLDKVISIDQRPIGRSPRSNPSTYIKLFDEIRDLFCKLPESQARGYQPGRFSFNVKEGSCPECSGMGLVKIDMDFLDDAWVECSLCQGKRFDSETLSVYFKGKNIYDVLEMEVAEAMIHFQHQPSILHKLETLESVGLEYMKLGQSSTTLSGGEAQRVKLAKELVRPATGKTLYIFDEPTTGLHFHDIRHLLEVLHTLVDHGNTVIVIEHNMDVVKTADWIIDLGPDGGEGGGKIIAKGTPEQLAKKDSPTGKAIQHALHPNRSAQIKRALKKKVTEYDGAEPIKEIQVKGASQNTLKHLDVTIPRRKITVCTGPSGSGKSSLAFDTVYAEGQRRYIESLSPYARQYVHQMPKPKVESVEGLSPAIAIEQKAHAGNPRSTVGTLTEVYDFLRILYARKGIAHCPETGEPIRSISKDYVVDSILTLPAKEKIQILAPVETKRNEDLRTILERFRRQGFLRVRLDGETYDMDEEDAIPYNRKKKQQLCLVIDRLTVDKNNRNRLFEAVEQAARVGENQIIIQRSDSDLYYHLSFAVESTGKSYPPITPHTFSFNTPEGMCPSCEGIGVQHGANLASHNTFMKLTPIKLIEALWYGQVQEEAYLLFFDMLERNGIDPYEKLRDLEKQHIHILFEGEPESTKSSFSFRWKGIHSTLGYASKSHRKKIREAARLLFDEIPCPDCKGARINALARHVTLNDLSLQTLCTTPIHEIQKIISTLPLNKDEKRLLQEVLSQLNSRLKFMVDVGLGYLHLHRSAPTLSGGEAQRIRLSRQLGSGLTGVLYVLDEPTIGLHPHDNQRLNRALKDLQQLGNTLLLVEHDPLTLQIADHVIDFGPGSGNLGGHITASGTLAQIKKNKKSLTGQYLSGKKSIPIPEKPRNPKKGKITIKKASLHNLKNLSVQFPISAFTCVTGVSGAGKSTLINQILHPAARKSLISREDKLNEKGAIVSGLSVFDHVLAIDQNPIGQTSRSDVGTYTDALTRMREFFASLPEARAKGLMPKHFSYNHRAGMCTRCWGLGYRKVEMHFLPPVQVVCDDCKGMRLNPVSLEIQYQKKNFGQYLDTTITEAKKTFIHHPRIVRTLDTLISVGLGYLKLGQQMATLSGGEAQRMKLSRQLAKRQTGTTLYLMDEPTTGLHNEDIAKLLDVLQKLVDKGNTLIVIEHNLEVIKNADYVIELGPEAGENGGHLIASGSPEQLKTIPESKTAPFLVW